MRLQILHLAIALAMTSTAWAQAPTPFSTTIKNYAYIGKAGNNAAANPVMLYLSTSPSTAGGAFGAGTAVTYTNDTAQNINASGISNVDGFLYGLEYAYVSPASANGTIFRVGANAAATKVGVIPPPTSTDAGRPITYSFVNTAAGTMDANGNLWFTAFTFTDANLPLSSSKVDVFLGKVSGLSSLTAGTTSVAPTYYHLDISDPTLQTGYYNFMTSMVAFIFAGQSATNTNGGFQDMDLSPSDQKFYSYISFPNAPTTGSPYPEPPLNSHLVRIDVVNSGGYWGKVTLINSTPNTNPNYEEDGAYFDAAGDFYTVFTNGEYAKVDLTTGVPGTLTASSLALSGGEMRGDLATNSVVVPLPVKLISFSGDLINKEVALNWEIAEWQTIAEISIERSADSRDFTMISTQKQITARALFTDIHPIAGTSYYRLKMKSIGGETTYSTVLKIANTIPNAAVAYPNPVTTELSISTPSAGVTIKLFDMMGRQVALINQTDNSGQPIRLNIANLPCGSYLLSVKDLTTGEKQLSQVIRKQ